MATGRNGDLDSWVPSLVGTLPESKITMALTRCGLQTDRTHEISSLYADELDWTSVKDIWYDERVANRSSRNSSKSLLIAIRARLQSAGEGLPSVPVLPEILDQCRNERDQAQVLFLYLVNHDGLARFVVHEYLRRLMKQGPSALDFETDTVLNILDEFRDKAGEPLEYSESTQKRWIQGLRSALRNIGVLEGKTETAGQPPKVGDVPLQVAAYYSWAQNGDEWLTKPIGWLYLFQSEEYWEPQSKRLAGYEGWTHHEARSRVWFEPVDDFYTMLAEGSA